MEKTRTDIINDIVIKHGIKTYLEIGVRDGNDNYFKIKVDPSNKVGVDPEPLTAVKFRMTSDQYFKLNNKISKFDMVFVDGLHTYEQSYVDVINSLEILNENGFIIMHDCNPPTEYHIRSVDEYQKTRGQWNGDVFRAFIRLKSELKDYNCFVVDEDWGCGVITKKRLNRNFSSIDISNYNVSWVDFYENKKTYLDLITYEEFLVTI